MKPNRIFLILSSFSIAFAAFSQTVKDEFNEYRNQIMGEYQGFRQSVLNDYDTFLEAVWADFETFGAKSRYSEPKPSTLPVADDSKPEPNTEIPAPKPAPEENIAAKPTPKPAEPSNGPKAPSAPKPPKTPQAPKPPKMPSMPTPTGTTPSTPATSVTPTTPTTPTKPVTPAPEQANKPAPEKKPQAVAEYKFPYRGMELAVADVPVKIKSVALKRTDFAEQWRNIANGGGPKLVEAFAQLAKKHNFNDYLTYDALMHYVDARYPDASPSSRMSLVQYVLANLGVDARIALDEANQPLILIPFDQMVYARRFITVAGYPYYVFGPEGGDVEPRINGLVSTASLPQDRDLGRHVDLIVRDLKLPENMKDFDLHYGPITLQGQFNASIIPVLYHYPQMPVSEFAESNVLPEFRQQIVNQVKAQLDGMSKLDAVNALLRFSQSAFSYATDGQFHGFEKPYFFEELFYYPKSDCEDRSVFYTYLLWNALGVESHLLGYPVHESASVHLDDESLTGDHYEHEGKLFFISDPTFIGSRTGMCMPRFKKVAPTIEKVYQAQ